MKKIITTLGAMLIGFASYAQITLSGASMITATGGNLELTLTTNLATMIGVNWSVNPTSVGSMAVVDGMYIFTAKQDGVATVTAVAFDAMTTLTGTKVITVSNQISSLTLSGASTLAFGQSTDSNVLTVTGNLPSISASNLTWKITPSSLAGVSGFDLQGLGNGIFTVQAMSLTDNTVMSNVITVTASGFVALTSATITGVSSIATFRGKTFLISTFSPNNATNPKLSWSSSAPCTASIDAASGEITAKRNGVVTITGTWTNGGGSVSATYLVNISGQKVYHETFIGTYDGNPYTMPSTYDPRSTRLQTNSLNGQFPVLGVSNYPWKAATATNQLDYAINNSNTTFDTDGPFWSGVRKIGFGLEGSDHMGGGCGIDVSTHKTVSLDLENKGTTALTLQLTAHDQDFGGFFGANSGTAYEVVVPAMTRTVVTQVLPNSFTAVKFVGVRVKDFVGDMTIYSLTVGANSASGLNMVSGSSILLAGGSSQFTSTVMGMDVVNKVSYQVIPSATGLITSTTSGTNNLIVKATGLKNGTVTVIGSAFNSTFKQMSVITVTNQVVEAVIATVPITSVEVGGKLNFTSKVLPSGMNQAVTWTVSPVNYGSVSVTGTGNIFMAGTTTGVATITGISDFDFTTKTSFTVTIVGKSTLSVTNAINAASVVLYPNPATDKVSVSGVEVASIIVVNTLGQVVASSTSGVVNVSGVNAGIYKILITSTSGASVTKTLVKE